MSAWRAIESIVILTPLRLVLGGLFVFAGWVKIGGSVAPGVLGAKHPQEFANSIKAFRIFDLDAASHLVVFSTFAMPWAEILTGLLLIFGLWTRPAALLVCAQLIAFTVAILSVIIRGLEVTCGCFGDYEWPCHGAIGSCHVYRDLVLLLAGLVILWRGGGLIALDTLRAGSGTCSMDSGGPEA